MKPTRPARKYKIKCLGFHPASGEAVAGWGRCRNGDDCTFAHPDDPEWPFSTESHRKTGAKIPTRCLSFDAFTGEQLQLSRCTASGPDGGCSFTHPDDPLWPEAAISWQYKSQYKSPVKTALGKFRHGRSRSRNRSPISRRRRRDDSRERSPRGRSLAGRRSASPPLRKSSRSPQRRRSGTPLRDRSYSTERRRSRSPWLRRSSRSPYRRLSRLPLRNRSHSTGRESPEDPMRSPTTSTQPRLSRYAGPRKFARCRGFDPHTGKPMSNPLLACPHAAPNCTHAHPEEESWRDARITGPQRQSEEQRLRQRGGFSVSFLGRDRSPARGSVNRPPPVDSLDRRTPQEPTSPQVDEMAVEAMLEPGPSSRTESLAPLPPPPCPPPTLLQDNPTAARDELPDAQERWDHSSNVFVQALNARAKDKDAEIHQSMVEAFRSGGFTIESDYIAVKSDEDTESTQKALRDLNCWPALVRSEDLKSQAQIDIHLSELATNIGRVQNLLEQLGVPDLPPPDMQVSETSMENDNKPQAINTLKLPEMIENAQTEFTKLERKADEADETHLSQILEFVEELMRHRIANADDAAQPPTKAATEFEGQIQELDDAIVEINTEMQELAKTDSKAQAQYAKIEEAKRLILDKQNNIEQILLECKELVEANTSMNQALVTETRESVNSATSGLNSATALVHTLRQPIIDAARRDALPLLQQEETKILHRANAIMRATTDQIVTRFRPTMKLWSEVQSWLAEYDSSRQT